MREPYRPTIMPRMLRGWWDYRAYNTNGPMRMSWREANKLYWFGPFVEPVAGKNITIYGPLGARIVAGQISPK